MYQPYTPLNTSYNNALENNYANVKISSKLLASGQSWLPAFSPFSYNEDVFHEFLKVKICLEKKKGQETKDSYLDVMFES